MFRLIGSELARKRPERIFPFIVLYRSEALLTIVHGFSFESDFFLFICGTFFNMAFFYSVAV
ncbi:hypothetical protein T4A_4917 [Trichinella pseudospiralis]|uniref:Uncharacterized protein n=1 Tax=Trichinella pseudospiralis TaxID=6337 RepID=A0A0V1EPI7_TRIPS|nr:hypothetical protein T4A_4917 [Trichinella pseudospiralis]